MPGKRHFRKSGLGYALVNKNKSKEITDSSRHTAILNDGSDYGKLNLRSVTQESSLDQFLNIAQLAGEDFAKDHENVTIITNTSKRGVLSEEEKRKLRQAQEESEELITVPRRPLWNQNMSPEDLTLLENETFLHWRRGLAKFQEESGLILTPFEKTIEFWRQLWRVVERSDVIVQVLDSRNPLLFLCKDLQKYVKEVDEKKINLIILNKADLLTEEQRSQWASYFRENDIRAVFFSAMQESTRDQPENKSDEESSENDDSSSDESSDAENDESSTESQEDEKEEDEGSEESEEDQESEDSQRDQDESKQKREFQKSSSCSQQGNPITSSATQQSEEEWENSPVLLSREDLVNYFRKVYPSNRPRVKEEFLTIGLVGYPNVGKSSTINALIQAKKVSISATPGKTKHFQTIFLDNDLCLCDCPGLVFPNFVSSKAEMILNGILPIDQMTDHVPPVNLLISLIPGRIFETQYSITLPQQSRDADALTAEQLLNSYGYMRGFMTQRGLPDNPRSARYLLKDFVAGKLLYCVAPPGYDQTQFHQFSDRIRPQPAHIPLRQNLLLKTGIPNPKDFESDYFKSSASQVHAKGPTGPRSFANRETGNNLMESGVSKPWKKHFNRNKKQKLRKAFAHLDIN